MVATIASGNAPYAALGRRIKELRRAARLSQRQLADACGFSEGYPPKIEAGKVRPDPIFLRRIAAVTGASYAELAVLADYMNEPTGLTPEAEQIARWPREEQRIHIELREYIHRLYDALRDADRFDQGVARGDEEEEAPEP